MSNSSNETKELVGIACVYGVTVSIEYLLIALDLDINTPIWSPEIKFRLETGLSIYTHPDWEDMVILGSTIVVLDVDPTLTGSRMAPVINIPDVIDFSKYTDDLPPMYYQVPLME